MKSKTKIMEQLKRKRNPIIVNTILAAKKNENWYRIAELLSSSNRKFISVNLGEISEGAKDGEVIVVPGKVLSVGEIDKKIKIAALSFSAKTKEKLASAGCKTTHILEEIKSNSDAKDVRILEK